MNRNEIYKFRQKGIITLRTRESRKYPGKFEIKASTLNKGWCILHIGLCTNKNEAEQAIRGLARDFKHFRVDN